MPDTLITLAEASRLTGTDQETLKKRCQAGKIKDAQKKGKTWLVPVASITGKERLRAGVYIDGSNIYHGGKEAGWQLGFFKLRQFIERKYFISIISYYNCTGYKQDKDGKYLKDKKGRYILDKRALGFENCLRGLGFRVVTKPLKFISGDEQKPSNKTDGDLMIDAILEHKQWDELLLFAGDCDYEKLVKQISNIPKTVHIFSFESRLSYELKALSFQSPYVSFTKLKNLENILKYSKKK